MSYWTRTGSVCRVLECRMVVNKLLPKAWPILRVSKYWEVKVLPLPCKWHWKVGTIPSSRHNTSVLNVTISCYIHWCLSKVLYSHVDTILDLILNKFYQLQYYFHFIHMILVHCWKSISAGTLYLSNRAWQLSSRTMILYTQTEKQRSTVESALLLSPHSSKTCATTTPTLLLLVLIDTTEVHLFVSGSYFSILFKLELPSLPPTAYRVPSITATSWVLRRVFIGARQVHESATGS